MHRDSLGLQSMERWHQIHEEIVDAEVRGSSGDWSLKLLRRITRAVKGIPKVQGLWQRAVLDNLRRCSYRVPGPDWPPVIEFKGDKWSFRRK